MASEAVHSTTGTRKYALVCFGCGLLSVVLLAVAIFVMVHGGPSPFGHGRAKVGFLLLLFVLSLIPAVEAMFASKAGAKAESRSVPEAAGDDEDKWMNDPLARWGVGCAVLTYAIGTIPLALLAIALIFGAVDPNTAG